MLYLRKVICDDKKINVVFENQANALSLYTKLYDKGFKVKLEDLFLPEGQMPKTNDKDIKKLLNKV